MKSVIEDMPFEALDKLKEIAELEVDLSTAKLRPHLLGNQRLFSNEELAAIKEFRKWNGKPFSFKMKPLDLAIKRVNLRVYGRRG